MAKTFQNPEGKLDWQALGASLAAEFSGRLMYGVPLADYTSWKVGGPAALMAWPETAKDCSVLLEACRRDRIPYRILGCGTNLLVADTGVEALVINMTGQKGVFWQGARVRAEAGASLSNLAAQAGQRELSGLEFGIGIPGSVGGGVLMNAGAYGFQMSDVVRRVEVLTSRGEKKELEAAELGYCYRKSLLQEKGWLVLAAELELTPGDGRKIRSLMRDYLESRRQKQPLELPNGGSVFKNPTGEGAGRFIDQAGLKGLRIGAAQVSPKHANFIVNLGGARAEEIRELIQQVQATVAERFGVELEREVIYWGF